MSHSIAAVAFHVQGAHLEVVEGEFGMQVSRTVSSSAELACAFERAASTVCRTSLTTSAS
jgi:hypothetical protein